MRYLQIIMFIVITHSVMAQTESTTGVDSLQMTVEVKTFQPAYLERQILNEVNKQRKILGFNELTEIKVLKNTAKDQAAFMSEVSSTEQDNPGERAVLYGGTRNVSEIVAKLSVSKKLSYQQVAQQFVEKWHNNSKTNNLMTNHLYVFAGVATAFDMDGQKLYVSLDLGDNSSIAPVLNKMAAKYISTKSFGVGLYNSKVCGKCGKIEGVDELAKYITTDGTAIYLECDNLKKLKQIVKSPDDGLAIDIVSRNQFPCNRDNIISYNNPNKGIMLKPLMSEELYLKNTEAPKSNKIKVKLGDIPKTISADTVELNLMIIMQGKLCRNLFKPMVFIPKTATDFNAPIRIIKGTEFDSLSPQKRALDSLCKKNPFILKKMTKVYNCVCGYYKINAITTDVDYQTMLSYLDKVETANICNADSLLQLKMAILLNTFQTATLSQSIKDDALAKLRAIEPFKMSVSNNAAMYYFFCDDKRLSNGFVVDR